MAEEITWIDLGNMPYKEAWDLQERILQYNLRRKVAARAGGPDTTRHFLLFTEHPPVYTLGKSGDMAHVLLTDSEREARGIEFYHTNRGGDITFHGPGQVVGYPVLDLERFTTDIGRYLRNLEEVIIRVMARYGLQGERSPGETGVWLDPDQPGRERKICAMGVRCSRWVTMHGFAFNVNTDLSYFDSIIPCGIVNKQVTSLQRELGHPVDMEQVRRQIREEMAIVFGAELRSELLVEVEPVLLQ